MIVRQLQAAQNTDRRIISPDGNWESTRLLLKNDQMGYSFHITTIYKGADFRMHYQNHLESVYCISGKGEIESLEDGTVYPYIFDPYPPQPMENRFSGNVYVLVNRQTHSQAAVMAAQMQDYGFATIVGEETGDFPSLCASQYSFGLPITGLNVKVSKGHIVRVNGSKAPEGVIPDIIIKDHLLDEDDEILAGLLEIIEEGR